MFDSDSRPPAPELSPDELVTTYEFGIHSDAYDTTEVEA
jgi:hypothetical protein